MCLPAVFYGAKALVKDHAPRQCTKCKMARQLRTLLLLALLPLLRAGCCLPSLVACKLADLSSLYSGTTRLSPQIIDTAGACKEPPSIVPATNPTTGEPNDTYGYVSGSSLP